MRQERPRHARVFLQYPCQARTRQDNRVWAVAGRKPPMEARFPPRKRSEQTRQRSFSQRQAVRTGDTETYFVLKRLPCRTRAGARSAERLFQPVATTRHCVIEHAGCRPSKPTASDEAITWASVAEGASGKVLPQAAGEDVGFLQHHRHQWSPAPASMERCRWSLADSSSALAIRSRRRFCAAKLPAIPAKMLKASSPPVDSPSATSSSASVLRSLKLGWGSVVIV